MITGEIKNHVDRIWDAFWAGGIANPLEVMEQITYLLFIRRLDDMHTLQENKANRLKQPMERPVFPAGKDARGRPFDDYVQPGRPGRPLVCPRLGSFFRRGSVMPAPN